MARPRDPTKLKVARGKSHVTKAEIEAAEQSEIYAANGEIVCPDWLAPDERRAFEREADYMRRVNVAAGANIYGDTDIDALATMVASHGKYLDYKIMEEAAEDETERSRLNAMKNKEAATYERYMRLLKLDPSSRVDFAGLKGGADGSEQDAYADI